MKWFAPRSLLILSCGFFAVALLASCASPGDPEIPVPDPVRTASISVDTSTVLRSNIPSSLFGTNVEWIEKGNGIADSGGAISTAWTTRAASLGLHHVRWPGGIFSDYYHWIDGTGPVSARPSRPHHTDPSTDVDVLGTSGVASWVKGFGGSLMITVNAGTGTASEAADWVRYCNDPANAARIADGSVSPFNVTLWEVGNELYLPDNPGDPKVAIDGTTYAARFMSYASAMRAAWPAVPLTIMAIGRSTSSWYVPGNLDWIDTLLGAASSQIDVLAVHNAYFPYLYNDTESARTLREVYQAMWAAPEAIGASLDGLAAKLSAAETSAGKTTGSMGLAVSEWGPLFGSSPKWIDYNKTLGSGLYAALVFQVLLERDRVRFAEAFKLSDSFTQGWIGYDGKLKPIAQVFALFAKEAGSSVVATSVGNSLSYATAQVGGVAANSAVAELRSQAALSADGKKLFVSIVNRSWTQPYDVTLSLPAAWSAASGSLTLLHGSSPTDHYGPDVQSWVPTTMYQEVPRSGDPLLETSTVTAGQTLSIPPFSFAFLEFTR